MIIERVKLGHDHIVGVKKEFVEEDNLNLTHLSKTPTTLSSMGKPGKPNEVKDQMSPLKKKIHLGSISDHAVPDHVRKSMSWKQTRTASNVLNSAGEVKSLTMIRAEEVQSSLGAEFHSFVKVMFGSHVSNNSKIKLPVLFCKSYLPNNDAIIILENESGVTFEVKFIAEMPGFGAGWKFFSSLHNLLAGDVLVFQLTEANKFKVYITRANAFTEVDGSLGLVCPVELSENDSEVIGSKLLVDSEFSSSSVTFEDIKSFEDFKSTVKMSRTDSELPEHIWAKYYELCRSQNSILHAHLLQDLNCPLVTGIIFGTVNIADAIRGCKLTTSREEFANWEKTLKPFELMGMNVGFLRARLHWLQTLAFESEDALKAKRYIEAETRRVRVVNRMWDLKAELVELKAERVELKAEYEKIDAVIETLSSGAESYKVKFQKAVDTPW